MYPNQTNTVVFTLLSTVKRTEFHLSSTIIGRISLLVHVSHSPTGLHCNASQPRLNNIAKQAGFGNCGVLKMRFGSHGVGQDDKYISDGLVELLKIVLFCDGVVPLDRVYHLLIENNV